MSKRFTIKYEYSIDGLTWIDFSDIVDSTQTKLTHNLCTQGFKSAKDSCTFTIPAVTNAVKNQLIEDLLGTDDLHFRMNIPAPVQVYWGDDKVQWDSNDVYWDGNTIGFVGYIDRSSVDLKSFPLPTSLTLTAYDVSFLHLDDKVDKYITLENKTITQIVHALLADAGYSYDASALDAGDEVTLQAFVIDKDNSKSYREYIDTLLFEAGGYVLDFTPGGFARIFHLPWDDANGPYRSISNPMNADGVQIKSAYLKEDGVRMKWSTLKWSDADRQIWRDSINRKLDGNNVMQGEEIAAGAYWPQNAEVTPSYMEYSADFLDDPYLKLDTRKKNEDLSIIMAKNIYAEIYAEQNGSQYVFPQPAGYPIPADFQAAPYNFTTNPMLWPQKAWYLLYNSTASPINLTSFIIRGTVLYRDRINTLETDGSTNPKEYVSEYIYNSLQAQRFLDFYWHFLQTSRFTMTWSEPYLIEDLGDVVEIMQKGMTYTQDAVIVAKTIRFANDKTPIVQYSAVGVAVPVLSNGVAYSTVPQGSSAIPSQEELTVEQKIEDIEGEVENWDFAIEQSAVPRNDRIPWSPLDPDSYTDIKLESLQKGYGLTEYWECDGTSSPDMLTYFVGANSQKTSGSTPTLRIYKQETCSEIHVTMGSSEPVSSAVHSITKVIKINNETEYDHDFAVWEPTDDGTNIYLLPDHFTVNGVDYDIIKGDYFVAKVTFAPYSSGTTVVSPSGDPSAQGWYERKGNGTGAKPYYWQKTTDTSVVVGKTYGTIGAGNQKFEAGYAYMYSGSSWDGLDITDEASARKAANLLDDLVTGNVQIPESTSNFSMWKWAKNFAAQNAIIINLFSQAITILSGGHIKSENYSQEIDSDVCDTDISGVDTYDSFSFNETLFKSAVSAWGYGVYRFYCTQGSRYSGTWSLYQDSTLRSAGLDNEHMEDDYGVRITFDGEGSVAHTGDEIIINYYHIETPGQGFYLGADGTFICNDATANALTIKGDSFFSGIFDCGVISVKPVQSTSIDYPTDSTISTQGYYLAKRLTDAGCEVGKKYSAALVSSGGSLISSPVAYVAVTDTPRILQPYNQYFGAVTFYDATYNPVNLNGYLPISKRSLMADTPNVPSDSIVSDRYISDQSVAYNTCYFSTTNFKVRIFSGGNKLNVSIPSSATGLSSGDLYYDPGTGNVKVKI